MPEVGLLVVMGREDDVVDDALEHRVQLLRVVFHGLRVQDLAVVFAGVEILVVVFSELDLLLVVGEFEVCDVVWFFQGRVIRAAVLFLFFPLLLFLLELFGGFGGFSGKVFGADLAAEDTCLCPVAAFDAKGYLGEDEFCLLAAFHRAKGFDLELAEDVGGGGEVALVLFHVGEDAGDTGSFDFDEYLRM